jgi:hypothetical protein
MFFSSLTKEINNTIKEYTGVDYLKNNKTKLFNL